MTSPTQRSLAHLRDKGCVAQVVEKWIAQARKRVDLFGVIDIIALDDNPGVLGVQTTTSANLAARIKKAAEIPEIRIWLARGNRLHFHGWRKSRLSRRWECHVRSASVETGEFLITML